MTHTATSKNGVQIRLSDERWIHITIGHPEIANYFFGMLETIEEPETVYFGNSGELLAIKKLATAEERLLVVVYKELADQTGVLIDGFVITAYSTSRMNALQKRSIAWQP